MTTEPTENEALALLYLQEARRLAVTECKLTDAEADRVVILHALSRISDDPARIVDWLRAEAQAIELHGTAPAGNA